MEDKRASFNFEDLVDFVDFSSFRFLLTALSANKIAIATSRYLIIVEDNARLDQKSEAHNNTFPPSTSSEDERLQTVVEFGEVSGRPTAIAWIAPEIVCVGFESGGLSCFNPFGDTITEIEFANFPVAAIHTYRSQDPKVTEQEVWALYENKFIVSIPISHLLGATGTMSRYYLKFKLMDQTEVMDFVVLPEPFSMNIFDAEMNAPNNSFVVVGVEPSLSLYNIGGKQHFQHLGKLASYVRERVSSAISKTVSNALVSFFGSGGGPEPPEEEDYTPITSSLDFVESSKRRICRVSLDPTGKLLAAADTLGRVLLFDMRYVSTVLRVWKGVREAHFAWTMDLAPLSSGSSSGNGKSASTRSYQLSLAIYAPQLGLLSLYQARHGPCLRSIPVGPQCQIFTVQQAAPSPPPTSSLQLKTQPQVQPQAQILYKCALLRTYPESPTLLQWSLVSPFDHADDDIDLNELQAQAEAEAKSEAEALEKHHTRRGDLVGGKSMLSAGGGRGSGGLKLSDLLLPHFGSVSPFPPPLPPGAGAGAGAGGVSTASGELREQDDGYSGSGSGHGREECLRFLNKVEKLLKEVLFLVTEGLTPSSSSSSSSAEGKGSEGNSMSSSSGDRASSSSLAPSHEHTMSSIEHRLWVLLSSPSAHALFLSSLSTDSYDGEGVALLLHCLSLVERVEVTMYTHQAYAEHAQSPPVGHSSGVGPSPGLGHGGGGGATGGGSNNSHNGNSKDCGLVFFSLQFHRNLCRLVEEVGTSTMARSAACDDGTPGSTPSSNTTSLPAALVLYAQNRSKVVKSYTMLMDLNAHLSLSEMTVLAAQSPPTSSDSSGSSGGRSDSPATSRASLSPARHTNSSSAGTSASDLGTLRAEALSWGARFLRPHYSPPSPSNSSGSSQAMDSSLHPDVGHSGGLVGMNESMLCVCVCVLF